MSNKAGEFQKRALGKKQKDANPANADSECPACRYCTKKHTLCGWRECPQFMKWLSDAWRAIQAKWGRG